MCQRCYHRWWRSDKGATPRLNARIGVDDTVKGEQTWSRHKSLKQKYGITGAQYDEMNRSQDGQCAICGGENDDGRPLHVDHDHETGDVRGLLCFRCNVMLGYARDDVMVLSSAAEYLRVVD